MHNWKPEIKAVMRDGKLINRLRCPKCGHWGDIDEDQYHGRISLWHECGFHKTINLAEILEQK